MNWLLGLEANTLNRKGLLLIISLQPIISIGFKKEVKVNAAARHTLECCCYFTSFVALSLASRPPDGIVPNDREWHCPALSLFGRYILTLLFTTDFCALRIVLRAQYTPYIPADEDKYFIF
jgi:hypothetical protein